MTRPEMKMYPALSVMEKRAMPLRYGHEPYWNAPVTPASRNFYLPRWNWRSVKEVPPGQRSLTLDVNGAYFAATGGVDIAHSHLKHSGEYAALPSSNAVAVGYYLITVPYWGHTGTIVHPLGDSPLTSRSTLWIAHPTLELLLELVEEGAIGDFGILDSWTTTQTTNFRSWQALLRNTRKELIQDLRAFHPQGAPPECVCRTCEMYDKFKTGYSAALSMMLTGEKCKSRRPDWAHAVQAHATASTWRKAWRFTLMPDVTLLAMGDTDEITILERDLALVTARSRPPFRVDMSGLALGAFKIKKNSKRTPMASNRPAALMIDSEEDIL